MGETKGGIKPYTVTAKLELKSQIKNSRLSLKVNHEVNPVPSDPSGILIEIFRKRIHLTEKSGVAAQSI